MHDDAAILRVLVADHRVFQRRLVAEALRGWGRVDVGYAETGDQCLVALSYFQPDALVVDWDLDGGHGLGLVNRLRIGEAGDACRKLAVIVVSTQHSLGDVERARNAGADEFVLRPFSTFTLVKRVQELQIRKREFVECSNYVGPCRRRRVDVNYDGPRRRLFDSVDKSGDSPDVQIRKGLVRMYIERIGALLRDAEGDAVGLRDVCLACAQLSTLAGDMKDRLLMSATSSLFSYVKGVGDKAQLNADVVKAHLDAIVQLAELPNSLADLRQTVTQQLSVMVTKKLRQAAEQAA
ncbi:MAG: response regulator transcription factor [Proteobacteria bacterium]|nr:response regulator transcription factor [Pseudomonadota bacterium]